MATFMCVSLTWLLIITPWCFSQEVYRREEHLSSFDCVVTSFFIDTAQNVLEYIEVIADVLKMGGVWINLGPLLYHWVDHSSGENSIEISLSDVERISAIHGFRCLRKEMLAAPYLGMECIKFEWEMCWWLLCFLFIAWVFLQQMCCKNSVLWTSWYCVFVAQSVFLLLHGFHKRRC